MDYFTGIGTKNREYSATMVGTNSNKPKTMAYLQIIFEYVGHNFSIIPLTDSVAKIGIFRLTEKINILDITEYNDPSNRNKNIDF